MKPDRNGQPATIKAVLILDGDVLVRMPVVQFFRDVGYQAVEAANTDEAMAILQKTNVPVDVVLSEIDIPGSMNGLGFAQWARSARPELKILLAGTPERTVRNPPRAMSRDHGARNTRSSFGQQSPWCWSSWRSLCGAGWA